MKENGTFTRKYNTKYSARLSGMYVCVQSLNTGEKYPGALCVSCHFNFGIFGFLFFSSIIHWFHSAMAKCLMKWKWRDTNDLMFTQRIEIYTIPVFIKDLGIYTILYRNNSIQNEREWQKETKLEHGCDCWTIPSDRYTLFRLLRFRTPKRTI